MKTCWNTALVSFLCLAALLFIPGVTQKTYAVPHTPARPQSGAPCNAGDPLNTGISYDATDYTTITVYSDAIGTPRPVGFFSGPTATGPGIGGWTCLDDGLIGLLVGNPGAAYYNLLTTVDGVTTNSVEPNTFIHTGYSELQLLLHRHKQYTFQVQSCTRLWFGVYCSEWSPTLQLTTAANSYCQNGYVWREAAVFDHVCVSPTERDQVASDNAAAPDRVDPAGAYGPKSCVSGYVWREAFGGDYVCVSPAERDQVAYDNSLALARIIAL